MARTNFQLVWFIEAIFPRFGFYDLCRVRGLQTVLNISLIIIGMGLPVASEAGVPEADDKPVIVSGMQIPYVLDDAKKGPYNVIFDEITKDYKGTVRLNIQPYKRAHLTFASRQSDCLYIATNKLSAYVERGFPNSQIIISQSINEIELRAYSKAGADKINSIEALKGSAVAYDVTAGPMEQLQSLLGANVEILPVLDIEQAFSLLDADRVSAAVVFDVDMEIWKSRKPKGFPYKPVEGIGLWQDGDALACWKNTNTRSLINHVNGKLPSLRASGWIKKTIREYHQLQASK